MRGAGMRILAVPAVLVVAAVVCAIVAAAGGGPGYAWAALSLVIVAFWVGLVLSLAVGLRARGRLTAQLSPTHTPAELDAANRAGRLAPARVVSITDTGTGASRAPAAVCDIALVVAPAKGKAYPATVQRLVTAADAARLAPDQLICVLEPEAGSGAVQIVLDPPPAWKPSSSRKRVAREG